MVLQVNTSEYFHPAFPPVLEKTSSSTSGMCMNGWEQRGPLHYTTRTVPPASAMAHLAHEASPAPSPTHAVYLPISWMSLVTAGVPSFPFPLLASLLCRIPSGIPCCQPTRRAPHPSIHQQALWPSREEQQSRTAVTLSRARYIFWPWFSLCKMQLIFTSVNHFKVFWCKRTCNTHRLCWTSFQPSWRASPASRPHWGSSSPPRQVAILSWQTLLQQSVDLIIRDQPCKNVLACCRLFCVSPVLCFQHHLPKLSNCLEICWPVYIRSIEVD